MFICWFSEVFERINIFCQPSSSAFFQFSFFQFSSFKFFPMRSRPFSILFAVCAYSMRLLTIRISNILKFWLFENWKVNAGVCSHVAWKDACQTHIIASLTVCLWSSSTLCLHMIWQTCLKPQRKITPNSGESRYLAWAFWQRNCEFKLVFERSSSTLWAVWIRISPAAF